MWVLGLRVKGLRVWRSILSAVAVAGLCRSSVSSSARDAGKSLGKDFGVQVCSGQGFDVRFRT